MTVNEILDFRDGDVLHSQACISKANELLGYKPEYDIYDGLNLAINWYIKSLNLYKNK